MSIDKSGNVPRQGGGGHRQVAKSAGVIGLATLCSRLLGFVRDIVIARLFGVYVYAQAFVIAFKIPNLFRDMIGEGASNAAFVPVFSEYTGRGRKEEFWELVNAGMNFILVVLSAITLLGILLSPVLVRLVAPGFSADAQQFLTTVKLNRLIFPYILLIGLTAYFMGVLNSLRHFAVPAFAPCLLNIAIIVCALVWGEGIKGLASGVLIGGVLQLAVQVPVLYSKGYRFRFSLKGFGHPDLKRILRLLTPRLFSTAIYQLNNFVDTIFGSLVFIVGTGGVAALYFSYRLIQFPLGIFSNSLSQAILPVMSTQAIEEDRSKLRKTVGFGLRSVLFVMIPASVAFMVLSKPMISALFRGGKFDAYAVDMTASALFFYSIGLFAYGATKVVNCAFFAIKDTVTPTKISVLTLVLNIVFNALLIYPLKIGGLALATSISGIVTFAVSLQALKSRIGGVDLAGMAEYITKVIAASAGMGAVCLLALGRGFGPGISGRALSIIVPVCAGAASYAVFCIALRVGPVARIWEWMARKTAVPEEI
ncbi:MAG: murein biosynthesis integral membrane protein MurJ [Deltaproteobacteria bacterium]